MSQHTTHQTSLGAILTRSHRVCLQAATREAGEHGLTYPQFRILETLYRLGPQSVGRVAERLLVAASSVTFVMCRLEESGLARRRRPPGDRRVVVAELTAEGEALAARAIDACATCLEELSADLGATDRSHLSELLLRLEARIAHHELGRPHD